MNKLNQNTKIKLLKLVKKTNNISQACKIMGISRKSYYKIKRDYDNGGKFALQSVSQKGLPLNKKRIHYNTEIKVVNLAISNPIYSINKIFNHLKHQGINISKGGVRCVCARYDLESIDKRLLALKEKIKQGEISTSQISLDNMSTAIDYDKLHFIYKTKYPGYLGLQDSLNIGYIEGIGQIFQQTYIDTYSRFIFVKIYNSNNQINSIDLLSEKVIPFFNKNSIKISIIATDKSNEYCGRKESHQYEIFLKKSNITHKKNCFNKNSYHMNLCRKLHTVLVNKFYLTTLKKESYTNIFEIQKALNKWVNTYNNTLPQTEAMCYGKTPLEALQLTNI